MALTGRGCSTFRCIETLGETSAQATVEAAVLLPAFLTLVLLAVQPVCLLYTRAVMESAASETARLMVTASSESEDSCRAFAQRRLAAVPNVSIFHAGGPLSWDIELGFANEDGTASVQIGGQVRPLPILGAFVRAFGDTDAQGNVSIEVSVEYDARPDWLEGEYETWVSSWGS